MSLYDVASCSAQYSSSSAAPTGMTISRPCSTSHHFPPSIARSSGDFFHIFTHPFYDVATAWCDIILRSSTPSFPIHCITHVRPTIALIHRCTRRGSGGGQLTPNSGRYTTFIRAKDNTNRHCNSSFFFLPGGAA